jgi:hypothetical protein
MTAIQLADQAMCQVETILRGVKFNSRHRKQLDVEKRLIRQCDRLSTECLRVFANENRNPSNLRNQIEFVNLLVKEYRK